MSEANLLSDRLTRQIQFIIEANKLKEIQRRTYLISGKRLENSAEHSWHLSLLVLVLQEYANESVDTLKVLRMVILHDLVEIDAGDVFLYDLSAVQSKQEAENRAAERLFGLLPEDQKIEFRGLWQEFEARQSAEARLAAALDRLIPLIHNLQTDGRTWKEHGITADQVYPRNQMIAEGSQVLWDWAKRELDRAVEMGVLPGVGIKSGTD